MAMNNPSNNPNQKYGQQTPQQPEANWESTKAKIKARWSSLSDTDIDSLKGNIDGLKSKLVQVAGLTKEQAEREFNDFKSSIDKSARGGTSQTAQPGLTRTESDEDSDKMVEEGNPTSKTA